MFKELAPYLRQRAVLLTVTHIEDDQIRVNVDLPRFSQPFIAGVSRFRFVGEYISPPS